MVFSSVIFLFFFLPLILGVYYFSPKRYRNAVLLLASLLFYFWGEGKYILVLIACIIFNYLFALTINRNLDKGNEQGSKSARRILILSMIFNIGLLFSFKYLNFAAINLNHLFPFSLCPIPTQANPYLSLGISFFTFQAISYVVDVYRKEVKAQKSLLNFAMYKSFFPQLIAGPIVR